MSSPASSPRGEQPPEQMMTPRSKIRALMARIDSSSDIETPIKTSRNVQLGQSLASDSGSSEEGDDSDVPLPRGRLAGRLRLADPSLQNEGALRLNKTSEADDGLVSASKRETQNNQSTTDSTDARATGMKRVLFMKSQSSRGPLSPSLRHSTSDPRASTQRTDAPVDASSNSNEYPAILQDISEDSENPDESQSVRQSGQDNARFLALIAKNRAARHAREAANAERERKRQEQGQRSSDRFEEILDGDVGADGDDPEADQALSSQMKPTRKASKKAIEAMNRETQRMSRNQQLAHATLVRKKYTKADLFSKFNFGQPKDAAGPSSSSPASSPRPTFDSGIEHTTPLSSPVSLNSQAKSAHVGTDSVKDLSRVSLSVCISDTPPLDARSQGKDQRALEVRSAAPAGFLPDSKAKAASSVRNFRVKLFSGRPRSMSRELSDTDSELEIGQRSSIQARINKALSNLPVKSQGKDDNARLKALAYLSSPSRKTSRYTKHSIPAAQMYADLQLQARKQAAMERMERVSELRAKGIIIQTAEEREREQIQNEDLLERARKEVEELTKRERDERKRAGDRDGATGDSKQLDDSDDGSYNASGDDDEVNEHQDDDNDLSLSGSDEEEATQDEDGVVMQPFFDGSESEVEAEGDKNHSGLSARPLEDLSSHSARNALDQDMGWPRSRRIRAQRVVDDEDDEPEPPKSQVQAVPESEPFSPVIVNPFAKLNDTNQFGAVPMGLSQAFAATMEDASSEEETSTAFPLSMPEPNLPILDHRRIASEQRLSPSLCPSINPISDASPTLHFTQRDVARDLTQVSEMPEPTQDGGMLSTSPVAKRFTSVPPSTVETILLPIPRSDETAGPRKRGRLIRRSANETNASEAKETGANTLIIAEDVSQPGGGSDTFVDFPPDAFSRMKKTGTRPTELESFNKRKSNAQGMVDEQAEESEDEYAGLGGASDDDSSEELDEETRKMLDDGKIDLNESQLAAFHADKERTADEKAIEKLYKDINSGALRRKRGAAGGFDDLSDSDEETERRRRFKRAEFAKMRKALLADEKVGKIAENPKKAAFLKAIEDREDEQDGDFLEGAEVSSTLVREDSIQEIPNSQPSPVKATESVSVLSGEKRKRPLEQVDPNLRPPPAARRTNMAMSKKPATLAEIRESLSFLIEDSHDQDDVQVAATQSSDADDDVQASRFAERRRVNSIVDRLSLRRAESAETQFGSSRGRLAFLAGDKDDQGFRIPSLLRSATSSSSNYDVTYTTERTAGGRGRSDGEYIRRGGTKKSSISSFARLAGGDGAVAKVEKRMITERRRVVEGRRGILKSLSGGTFE